jgi:hypothetical protein
MSPVQSVSRKQARERGLRHYFTGKPCKCGHVAERLLSNGDCIVCAKVKAARWQKTPKGKTYQRQYHQSPKMVENREYDRKRYLERKQAAPESKEPTTGWSLNFLDERRIPVRIPTKSAVDSERRRPPVPIEAGRGFR